MNDSKQSIARFLLIRALRLIGLTIVLGWILCTLGLWLFQERLIFPASSGESRMTPDRWKIPFKRQRVTTADGEQIDVWWMPNQGGQAILFCHGNGDKLGDRLETFRALHSAGFQVLAFDYRGYGTSSGQPTEQGLYHDADAVWHFATQELAIPAHKWIVHGRSLGGAIAVYLAHSQQVGGLIIESSFTSLPAVAAEHYPFLPVNLIARHIFPSLMRVAELKVPLLVIHGREDQTTPFGHGEALFAAAPEAKTFVALKGGHNSSWYTEQERWLAAIRSFAANLPAESTNFEDESRNSTKDNPEIRASTAQPTQ